MQEAGFQATNAFTECKFTCTSGQCLYLGSLVCNQQNDCGDNSDEENCLLVTEHPPPGIFSSLTRYDGLSVNINEHNNNKTGSSANECGLLQ
ncbi:hypothetical protein G4228_016760 [Cervus hanglu yarkandensis]|nr:hypothetical protein G4228_016760 [Cervus hanglu yarkandensis]